jgi:hypothetical protein
MKTRKFVLSNVLVEAALALLITFTSAPTNPAIAQDVSKKSGSDHPEVLSVTGTWEGRWESRSGLTGRMLLHLKQEGERGGGTMDSPDASASLSLMGVKLEGTLKGAALSLKRTEIYGYMGLTVHGNSIEGSVTGKSNIPYRVTLAKQK